VAIQKRQQPTIYLSKSADALKERLKHYRNTVTVEAEYGDILVEGSIGTLAHHGIRADQPAPCLAEADVWRRQAIHAIGISHIDMDTIGGIMAVTGYRPGKPSFWELVAYVDVHGPHKIYCADATEEDRNRLYACWAYLQENRVEIDGETVQDVTQTIRKAMDEIDRIITMPYGESPYHEEGEELKQTEWELERSSLVEIKGGVAVRVSDRFVNHLYYSSVLRIEAQAVVAMKTLDGSITISFANGDGGADQIVKQMWGPKAGGRSGIAGSPRGVRLGLTDLAEAAKVVAQSLMQPKCSPNK
jgi:hypothetical protein